MTFAYRGPSGRTLRIYVWTTRDGLLFCRWDDLRIVQSIPKVFVGGPPVLESLNDDQTRALLHILYGGPLDKKFTHAVFYSGNEWAQQRCPDGRRGKIIKRFALHHP